MANEATITALGQWAERLRRTEPHEREIEVRREMRRQRDVLLEAIEIINRGAPVACDACEVAKAETLKAHENFGVERAALQGQIDVLERRASAQRPSQLAATVAARQDKGRPHWQRMLDASEEVDRWVLLAFTGVVAHVFSVHPKTIFASTGRGRHTQARQVVLYTLGQFSCHQAQTLMRWMCTGGTYALPKISFSGVKVRYPEEWQQTITLIRRTLKHDAWRIDLEDLAKLEADHVKA